MIKATPIVPPVSSVKEPTDTELAKARVRAAAAAIDPLRPVREHPYISSGVALAAGFALAGFPVGIKPVAGMLGLTLRTIIPHLGAVLTSATAVASAVTAKKAADTQEAAEKAAPAAPKP